MGNYCKTRNSDLVSPCTAHILDLHLQGQQKESGNLLALKFYSCRNIMSGKYSLYDTMSFCGKR